MEAPPPMSAMDRLAASPPVPRSPPALLGAWVLTLVVLVGAVAATVTWRDVVMRAWPQSALILAPFGQSTPAHAQTPGKKTG